MITGNIVKNYAHIGIMNMNAGFTTISNNKTYTGPYYPEQFIPGWGWWGAQGLGHGKGIAVDWYPRNLLGTHLGSAYVTRNEIHCICPRADGIIFNNFRGNPIKPEASFLITHNHIILEDCISGMRLNELSNIRENDIDWDTNTITMYRKR